MSKSKAFQKPGLSLLEMENLVKSDIRAQIEYWLVMYKTNGFRRKHLIELVEGIAQGYGFKDFPDYRYEK